MSEIACQQHLGKSSRNSVVFSPMRVPTAVAIVSFLSSCLFAQTTKVDLQQNSRSTEKIVNGEFVGMEEIKNYAPRQKWFHENSLLIRDNDVILDKVPLHVVKGKKQYSASDGGFITYRGQFFHKDGQVFISLRPFESDYIIFPTGGCEPYSKVTTFRVEFTTHGIEIDGVLYRAATFSKQKTERLSQKLQNEPMEYTGARPYSVQYKRPPCP